MQSLDQLKLGQSGRVTKIDLKAAEGQRLMEMGLTLGAKVKLLKIAPMGDPMEILIRGYHLSIRKSEASLIHVETES